MLKSVSRRSARHSVFQVVLMINADWNSRNIFLFWRDFIRLFMYRDTCTYIICKFYTGDILLSFGFNAALSSGVYIWHVVSNWVKIKEEKKYTKINELKNNLIRFFDIKKILIWSDEITQIKLKLSKKTIVSPERLIQNLQPPDGTTKWKKCIFN